MTMRRPSLRNARSAACADGFMGSAIATTPAARPSIATVIAVAPSCRARAAAPSSVRVSMFNSRISIALPSATALPSTVALAPLPDGEAKSPTSLKASPRCCAASRIARASGCSLPRSTLAARRSNSFSSTPAAGITATTFGLPSVSVPVLSITSVSMRSSCSSACASRTRIPACAPRPMPTMIDIGVASPSAQGQAMISTVTAATRPKLKRGSGPNDRPRRERQHRRGDHRRHEPAGDLIGQALDRRARALRPRHHVDDARQHGVAADFFRAHAPARRFD